MASHFLFCIRYYFGSMVITHRNSHFSTKCYVFQIISINLITTELDPYFKLISWSFKLISWSCYYLKSTTTYLKAKLSIPYPQICIYYPIAKPEALNSPSIFYHLQTLTTSEGMKLLNISEISALASIPDKFLNSNHQDLFPELGRS